MATPFLTDFDAFRRRFVARASKDAGQARRLPALSAIYQGAARSQAARVVGVSVQVVRDRVVKFNAHRPDCLIDRQPPGQPSRLTDAHRGALKGIIESSPIPSIHGVVRWRLVDLGQWSCEEFHSHHRQADDERGVACLGLSQAVGPAAPSRPGRWRD